jgi:hypothetical protein
LFLNVMTAFDVLNYIGISRVIMRSFLRGFPRESVERKVMRTHDPNGYLQEWNMLRITYASKNGICWGQGLRPGEYPRPSNQVLGRVLGTLKYLDTYSSNVELSTLVPGTYSSAPTDPIYLPDTYPSTQVETFLRPDTYLTTRP